MFLQLPQTLEGEQLCLIKIALSSQDPCSQVYYHPKL